MKEITIIGNLGANAVRRTTSEGRDLMTFNVAVNVKNQNPIWFNCIGSFREKLFDYLVKGQGVCVIGDLSASVYQGSPDLQISIDKCELVGSAPDQSSQQSPTPAPEQSSQLPTPTDPFA